MSRAEFGFCYKELRNLWGARSPHAIKHAKLALGFRKEQWKRKQIKENAHVETLS
jgi:hypothetical protein